MNAGTLFWLSAAGLAVACFAAIGAKVLQDYSAHELEDLCRKRRRKGLFGEIYDASERTAVRVESLQAVGTTVFVVAGMLWLLEPRPAGGTVSWQQVGLGVGLGSLALLIATVWLPWSIVQHWAAPFLLATWNIWRWTSRLLAPLSLGAWVFNFVMRRLAGRLEHDEDEEEAFEDEILAIVTEGERDGLLEADAREMIEGVIELGDAAISEIMTPRSRIDALSINQSWSDMLKFVIRTRRTRIPVYGKNIDDILGVLYVKDLLPELAKGPGETRHSLLELLRPTWFVPETNPVDDLLQQFLKTHNHLAIVLDEFQAVAGIVTIEDVLEEIVGEIVDEHDTVQEQEIRPLDEHTAEVLGRAQLDEINTQLGLELPEEEEYDTIAGLIFSRLGRIPVSGEQIALDGVRLTVLETTRRQIKRVRVESLSHSPERTG